MAQQKWINCLSKIQKCEELQEPDADHDGRNNQRRKREAPQNSFAKPINSVMTATNTAMYVLVQSASMNKSFANAALYQRREKPARGQFIVSPLVNDGTITRSTGKKTVE